MHTYNYFKQWWLRFFIDTGLRGCGVMEETSLEAGLANSLLSPRLCSFGIPWNCFCTAGTLTFKPKMYVHLRYGGFGW